MTLYLIALSVLIAIAAGATALAWRRRQCRRLLNSRETAHLLRQAQYLQQLVQTAQYCDLNAEIPRVLLRLADETLNRVSTTGQPDAQATVAAIRALNEQLERASPSGDGDSQPRVQCIQAQSAGEDDRDCARIRLHLTDTSRLLHRAFRKGFIDRNQHRQMTDDLQKHRLRLDIEQMLRREAEARSAGDQARARACLSQARARLEHQTAPRLDNLLVDIDRRLAELDRGAALPVAKIKDG